MRHGASPQRHQRAAAMTGRCETGLQADTPAATGRGGEGMEREGVLASSVDSMIDGQGLGPCAKRRYRTPHSQLIVPKLYITYPQMTTLWKLKPWELQPEKAFCPPGSELGISLQSPVKAQRTHYAMKEH
ncbi:hypothetical protein EYF80_014539 [Liparis tanakae]|uniref:Uncharacterized protein n=1 Tax=Liparis tanakae TaxID=230148 RepID=A0A4Z2ID08_9TELE|nr:hypothetical protein EYF80_014539 [Liparis tanakae]